jgi:CRISPR-associated exonuclease Cas4
MQVNRAGLLTARDLTNFAYCKRIPYFENVLHLPQATTSKEIAGRAAHHEFDRKSMRAKIIPDFPRLVRKYEIWLEDNGIGYGTIVDCVLFSEDGRSAFPVQVKDSAFPGFLYRGIKMQLLSEAYLVEKNFGMSVEAAFVKFLQSGELVKVRADRDARKEFYDSLGELKALVSSEIMPEATSYRRRCADCSFRNICRRA